MRQTALDFIGPITFDTKRLIVAPSKHAAAKETSALAAVANHPRRVTQNQRLRELLEKAGEKGIADPVIARMTGWSRQTICARRADIGTTPAETRWRSRRFNNLTYTRWRLMTDDECRQDEQPAAFELTKERVKEIEAGS